MSRPRKDRFAGWAPGLYRKSGKKKDLYYCLFPTYISLGSDLGEARKRLIEMQAAGVSPQLVAGLLDDFIKHREAQSRRDGRPSPLTISGNKVEANVLKKVFGHMRLQDLQTHHVWRYLHQERGAHAPVRANREISLLSSAFRYALNRGLATQNPCLGVEKNKERPRDRAVSSDELENFCAFLRKNQHHASASSKKELATGAVLAGASTLAFLTAKAESQILQLSESHISDAGILFGKRKHGFATLVEWTPMLRQVVEDLRALRPSAACEFLVTNRNGAPYTLSGFISIWRRAMLSWVANAPAGEKRIPFKFHDLRAMSITQMKEEGRDAKELSGHTTDLIPNRVYDRRRVRSAKAVR